MTGIYQNLFIIFTAMQVINNLKMIVLFIIDKYFLFYINESYIFDLIYSSRFNLVGYRTALATPGL